MVRMSWTDEFDYLLWDRIAFLQDMKIQLFYQMTIAAVRISGHNACL